MGDVGDLVESLEADIARLRDELELQTANFSDEREAHGKTKLENMELRAKLELAQEAVKAFEQAQKCACGRDLSPGTCSVCDRDE